MPLMRYGLSICAVCALTLTGCVTDSGGQANQAPSSTVSPSSARSAAYKVERLGNGRMAAQGSGMSMAPLYGDNTVVVFDPIAFDDLQPGMVVLYEASDGRLLCHALSRKIGQTWEVEGINNPDIDPERVHADNLKGVVYATFHSWEAASTVNSR
ncbi:S24/S26 family peptidase [Ruficoccus amylovorans]|uniref:S24/S26 family peptidase n=1 Tax=Ruficoccus amylovorans TaxID=1804625 RepID=A0A842HH46_9BACT|nr:S24/S26 family peptidase [Ruficoccus amylovorans]MBC2596055.1 S24/S26 family peptidase [Ruficoccus amylovorans]